MVINNVTLGITELINAIRNLTGVGICYYDLNAFFEYDKYGAKNNRGHYCAFCEKARSLPLGRASCDQSDKKEAIELAKQYRSPFFHECHMGMRELVIPLLQEDSLLGILFIGQCRTDGDHDETIKENAKRMGGDPNEFSSLYNSLPLISKRDLLSIGTILSQYFDTKILSNELLRPPTPPKVTGTDLALSVRTYIKQNYRYPLSTKQISDVFYVNSSYASRRFSERYGTTITEYICEIRIGHAKDLLVETSAPIGSIALNVGFDDANYFTRTFKKRVGTSPTKFRINEQRKEKEKI